MNEQKSYIIVGDIDGLSADQVRKLYQLSRDACILVNAKDAYWKMRSLARLHLPVLTSRPNNDYADELDRQIKSLFGW